MSGKTPASFDDVTVGGFPYQVLMEEVTWTWKLGLPRALSHRIWPMNLRSMASCVMASEDARDVSAFVS